VGKVKSSGIGIARESYGGSGQITLAWLVAGPNEFGLKRKETNFSISVDKSVHKGLKMFFADHVPGSIVIFAPCFVGR